jgi:conjugative relaxase-like TrwC/TraI family protein
VIAQAHRTTVPAATTHLEATAAWARRGRAGATREQTAGLLMVQFDHHTSRESEPQLHTHNFIFNLAPRRVGSWGAILSRKLYKAQQQAGATYRQIPASELEKQGIRLERQKDTFRVAAIRAASSAPSPSGARPSRKPRRSTATTPQRAWSWRLTHAPFQAARLARRAHQALAD